MRRTSPEIARWLLSCSLHDVDRDQVLGDLEETFFHLSTEYGQRRARAWYWSQVLRSLPSFIFRTISWSLIMFKSYLTLARRRMLREGGHTAINVVGMAVALALCIIAFINWQYDDQFDAFHEKGDRLYRINTEKEVGERTEDWGISPRPLAAAAKRDIPGIERTSRWQTTSAIVRRGDDVFREYLAAADPDFMDMFSFPFAQGSKQALGRTDQVILSKPMANKYFGDEQAMDQELVVEFGNGEERVVTVGGVLEAFPANSSLRPGILLPMQLYLEALDLDDTDWRTWGQLTFVEVADPALIPEIERQLQQYIPLQNEARPDWKISSIYAQPLSDLADRSRMIRGHNLVQDVPTSAVIGPAVMAVLVLIMACFNFINLSIVSSGGRMKEIGLRKVMGGRRRQMVGQLLGESLIQCFVALGLAIYLATVLTPMYDSLWPFMELKLVYRDNLPLLGFLVLLTGATALLAGLYPAWHASAFNPIRILRGTQRTKGANVVSRALLGFQYCLTIIGVAGSIVFVRNAQFQEDLDLGYARAELMVVPMTESLPYEPFRDALAQSPAIAAVAGSTSHIGASWYSSTFRYLEEDHSVDLFEVGEDYVETMGMRVLEGRSFSSERGADTGAVLINETLVREMGWDQPVGQAITMSDSLRFEVIGVVEDFYQNGVWGLVRPVVMRLADPEDYGFSLVRSAVGRTREAQDVIEATWRAMAPTVPYDGYTQNELLAEGIDVSTSIRKLFSFIGVLTLLIAGTGLFALVSLTIQRRTKEIGIRKVLGASLLHIGRILNMPFIVLIGAAAVVAAVGGYFLMNLLLGSIYAYHVDVGTGPFVIAAVLTLAVALLTVSGKIYRAGTRDPVHALRSE